MGSDGGTLFAASRRLVTIGMRAQRFPRYINALPDGGVYVAEAFDGGYSVWVQGRPTSFGETSSGGISACGSGSDSTYVACMQNTFYLSADDLKVGSQANVTKMLSVGGLVTNYRNASNQLRWIVASEGPNFVRQTHDAGAATEGSAGSILGVSVEGAATASDNVVWWSGKSLTTGVPMLMSVAPDDGNVASMTVGSSRVQGRVLVATYGALAYAGWVEGGLRVEASDTGFSKNAPAWAGWTLVDFAASAGGVVALVTDGTASHIVIVRGDGIDSFELPGDFVPSNIHLGGRLSVTGTCSRPGCDTNPVDQWDTRPDGGAW